MKLYTLSKLSHSIQHAKHRNPSVALAPFELAQINVQLHTHRMEWYWGNFLTFAKIHPHFTWLILLSLFNPLLSLWSALLCTARVNLSAYVPFGSTRIQRLIYVSQTRGGYGQNTKVNLAGFTDFIPAAAAPRLHWWGDTTTNTKSKWEMWYAAQGVSLKRSHCGQTDDWVDGWIGQTDR